MHDCQFECREAGQQPQRGQSPVEEKDLLFKSVHLSFQPEGTLKADSRPKEASWTNLRPERAEINPEKADWRPERAALKPAKSVGAY